MYDAFFKEVFVFLEPVQAWGTLVPGPAHGVPDTVAAPGSRSPHCVLSFPAPAAALARLLPR